MDRKSIKELEILAPAGDEKSAYAAINSGANAIYLGLTAFSARASAVNFDLSALEKLVKYAHAVGVKIYVAMNTLIKESELEEFCASAVEAWNVGIDAIIIQDIFVGKFLKKHCPQMVLHLSTQAGVNNIYGAKLALEYGFDRVILARETGLDDIKAIAQIIETEVFVQGALCTCFSGQCYLSSFAGGNSGNRGKCKQPCRKMYSINRSGFEDKAYAISLSDLSVGEDIQKLIDVGVTSFKIEGRMRRPEYVSAAVSYYKKILDGSVGSADKSALKRTFNRGNYTLGLAFGQDKSFISSAVQGHIGEYLGIVKVVDKRFICQTNSKCSTGDGFKILRDGREVAGANFGGDCKGGFYLNTSSRLKNGDKVFITTDAKLNERLQNTPLRLKKVVVSGEFLCGNKAKIELNGIAFESDFNIDVASNRPTERTDIEKCFNKKDIYPFEIVYKDIVIDNNAFVPVSLLNEFRRKAYSEYFERLTKVNKVEKFDLNLAKKCSESAENGVGTNKKSLDFSKKSGDFNKKIAVIATKLSGLKADIGILKLDDYHADGDKINELIGNFIGEKFLFLPAYLKGVEIERVKQIIGDFDGIYCDNTYAIELSKELGKKLFAGVGFNLSNSVAMGELKADYIALSKELTTREVKPLLSENTFYLTAGDIKVMDLIYCPFGRTCGKCDKKTCYELTDENGRKFPLKRYKVDDFCRFEIYNCASLVAQNNFTGALIDCTIEKDVQKIIDNYNDEKGLKEIFKNYTRGHSDIPVL